MNAHLRDQIVIARSREGLDDKHQRLRARLDVRPGLGPASRPGGRNPASRPGWCPAPLHRIEAMDIWLVSRNVKGRDLDDYYIHQARYTRRETRNKQDGSQLPYLSTKAKSSYPHIRTVRSPGARLWGPNLGY